MSCRRTKRGDLQGTGSAAGTGVGGAAVGKKQVIPAERQNETVAPNFAIRSRCRNE